jgi:hypothetical protein
MKKTPTFVKTRCLEIYCPHWGWVKIPFSIVDKYWWDVPGYDSGIELTFKCPACGEEHEINDSIVNYRESQY